MESWVIEIVVVIEYIVASITDKIHPLVNDWNGIICMNYFNLKL